MARPRLKIDHGFTWYRIIFLALIILIVFGVRYGMIVVPQVRETANKVMNLNDLKHIDFKIGGCIPVKGDL